MAGFISIDLTFVLHQIGSSPFSKLLWFDNNLVVGILKNYNYAIELIIPRLDIWICSYLALSLKHKNGKPCFKIIVNLFSSLASTISLVMLSSFHILHSVFKSLSPYNPKSAVSAGSKSPFIINASFAKDHWSISRESSGGVFAWIHAVDKITYINIWVLYKRL